VVFLTAVAVVRHRDDATHQFVDTTRVRFRALDEATIERYVARESPLDCAGGFKSEGLGISLCESIDSVDPSALIGLPLIQLCAVLRRVGFELP
jgi:septum formation protein